MPCPPRLALASKPLQSLSLSFSPRSFQSHSCSQPQPLLKVTNEPAPHTGHIRIIQLNRPSSRNAISRHLLASLRLEIDEIHSQYDATTGHETVDEAVDETVAQCGPTRALIIASAVPTAFCAGADLKERRGMTISETEDFLALLRSTLTNISALPIPTISAIGSIALGGGLELALSTHFRVLTSDAVIGLPETRLGIIPGAGGTYRLPALIGVARARDLILTGRRVAGAEAYHLGIADRLLQVKPSPAEGTGGATEAVLEEALKMAREISQGGPVAIRAALQALQRPGEEVENAMYERVLQSEDREEALRAFAHKRTPIFVGR